MIADNQEAPISFSEHEDKLRLKLRGAIDIFLAEQLHNIALNLEKGEADAIVDCEAVEQLGTAALQILFAMKEGLGAKGRQMSLPGMSPALATQFC